VLIGALIRIILAFTGCFTPAINVFGIYFCQIIFLCLHW
jgi:hypothetical protein